MQSERNENRIFLRGRVAAPPAPSHTNHGTAYLRLPLAVCRLSGAADLLHVVASRDQLEGLALSPGDPLAVRGEVRTFNNRSGVGTRLVITVLARTVMPGIGEPCNQVTLQGALCKPPVLRQTPLGRDICALLLAVNRRYRRADYLPCIAWGALALQCGRMGTGDPLRLEGRLQSRLYRKTIGETVQERTAFEISIASLLPDQEEGEGAAL